MEVCVGMGGAISGERILWVSLFFEIIDHRPTNDDTGDQNWVQGFEHL